MNKTVLEYLEGYFDGQLNESISDDNIMEAFAELLETANAVEEYIAEISNMRIANAAINQSARGGKEGQLQRVMKKLAKRGGGEEIKRYNRAVRHNAPNFTVRGQQASDASHSSDNTTPAGKFPKGGITRKKMKDLRGTEDEADARNRIRNRRSKRAERQDIKDMGR